MVWLFPCANTVPRTTWAMALTKDVPAHSMILIVCFPPPVMDVKCRCYRKRQHVNVRHGGTYESPCHIELVFSIKIPQCGFCNMKLSRALSSAAGFCRAFQCLLWDTGLWVWREIHGKLNQRDFSPDGLGSKLSLIHI